MKRLRSMLLLEAFADQAGALTVLGDELAGRNGGKRHACIPCERGPVPRCRRSC